MPELPEERDLVLWATDDDRHGNPVRAHRIVDPPYAPEDGQWPARMTSACGKVFTQANHPIGWMSIRDGDVPHRAHAIHCGGE